jgi:hypothetical protein
MTDLSPAAQQVFWEFNRAASGAPDDWHYLPSIAEVTIKHFWEVRGA